MYARTSITNASFKATATATLLDTVWIRFGNTWQRFGNALETTPHGVVNERIFFCCGSYCGGFHYVIICKM